MNRHAPPSPVHWHHPDVRSPVFPDHPQRVIPLAPQARAHMELPLSFVEQLYTDGWVSRRQSPAELTDFGAARLFLALALR